MHPQNQIPTWRNKLHSGSVLSLTMFHMAYLTMSVRCDAQKECYTSNAQLT